MCVPAGSTARQTRVQPVSYNAVESATCEVLNRGSQCNEQCRQANYVGTSKNSIIRRGGRRTGNMEDTEIVRIPGSQR